MPLIKTIQAVFDELIEALHSLSDYQYVQPSNNLSNTGIGQHVRHVIELYQCLLNGYEQGIVNYELRKRDKLIETNKQFAISLLQDIASSISLPDKELEMHCALGSDNIIMIQSNYNRELLYNLEHTIHHMALIRVGIQEVSDIQLMESFGVAPSTIQYKKECVQ